MIPVEDARAIVSGLNPSRLVRLAYRAAAAGTAVGDTVPPGPSSAPYMIAGVVLNLETGTVQVLRWQTDGRDDPMRMPRHLVALAWADTALVESIESRYAEGCALPPSREVLEECVARDAAADDIGVSWGLFEGQLKRSYGSSSRWERTNGDGRETGGEERV